MNANTPRLPSISGSFWKTPPLIRVALVFFFLLFLLHGVNILTSTRFNSSGPVPSGKTFGIDFSVQRIAGHALAAGLSIYRNNEAKGPQFVDPINQDAERSRYVYPPLPAYVFYPFTWFSPGFSFKLWSLCQVGLVVALLYAIHPFTTMTRINAIGIGLICLSSYPMLFILERGNFDTLPILLLTLAIVCWLKKRNDYIVGFLLAAAGCLKIYPFIFVVYFLCRRQVRVVTAAILFALLITLVFGMDHIPGYGEQLPHLVTSIKDHLWVGNHSMLAFFARLSAHTTMLDLESVFIAAGATNFTLLALALGFVLTGVMRPDHTRDKTECLLEVMVLLLAMTMCSTISYDYNLIFVFFILPILAGRMEIRENTPQMLQMLAVVCLVYILIPTWQFDESPFPLWRYLLASKVPSICLAYLCLLLSLIQYRRRLVPKPHTKPANRGDSLEEASP